nr:hypothetical protein [Tanacetum cinerariifolium]
MSLNFIFSKLMHLSMNHIRQRRKDEASCQRSKAELIKVDQEEATKAGVDLKILASAKGGQEFRKIQDAKIKVHNKEHSKKIKRTQKEEN